MRYLGINNALVSQKIFGFFQGKLDNVLSASRIKACRSLSIQGQDVRNAAFTSYGPVGKNLINRSFGHINSSGAKDITQGKVAKDAEKDRDNGDPSDSPFY
jgi:hypothetical protein